MHHSLLICTRPIDKSLFTYIGLFSYTYVSLYDDMRMTHPSHIRESMREP